MEKNFIHIIFPALLILLLSVAIGRNIGTSNNSTTKQYMSADTGKYDICAYDSFDGMLKPQGILPFSSAFCQEYIQRIVQLKVRLVDQFKALRCKPFISKVNYRKSKKYSSHRKYAILFAYSKEYYVFTLRSIVI